MVRVQLGLTPLGARTLLGLPGLARWRTGTRRRRTWSAGSRPDCARWSSAQPDWAGRFAVLDQLLDCGAAEADADRRDTRSGPRCGYAWRRLRETRRRVGVAELAAETGLSARRLGSLFRAEFGLAPKEAGRVFRFNHARRRIGQATMGGRLGTGRAGGTAGGDASGGMVPAGSRHTAEGARGLPSPGWPPSAASTTRRTWPASSAPWPAARRRRGWPRSSDSSKPRPPTSGKDRRMTQTPPPQVWPTLIARDARGLIKFLVDAFGFEETAVYGEGDQRRPRGTRLAARRRGDDGVGRSRLGVARHVPLLRGLRRPGHRCSSAPSSTGRAVISRAQRPGLRLARVLGARPGGEPMVVRHLPGPPR